MSKPEMYTWRELKNLCEDYWGSKIRQILPKYIDQLTGNFNVYNIRGCLIKEKDPLKYIQNQTIISCYETGKQYLEENYSFGQKNGIQHAWYFTGKQWYRQNYYNGKKHGIQIMWNS